MTQSKSSASLSSKVFVVAMDAMLQKVNLALNEAVDAFEGPLKMDRLNTLQTTDSLPDKGTWNLASQTVDLADKVLQLLQPPALQLAESYLGKRRETIPRWGEDYVDMILIRAIQLISTPNVCGQPSPTMSRTSCPPGRRPSM